MKYPTLFCALGCMVGVCLVGVCLVGSAAFAQTAPPAETGKVPLYRVTVIQRTVKAVNYRYRGEPTEIDFMGTVLLPKAKGRAWVQSKQGRTDIDASLEKMLPSQRYGREYLTYVLWAITPEGRPHNLGEIILNDGKGHLHVTTDLQAFALIVTAEPYSAVRTPSDVVVVENEIRPDTEGKIENVAVNYELLPRGQYTWQVSEDLEKELASAPRVSSGNYDALLELYEAQNAIGIARQAGAEQFAAPSFAKAEQLLNEAQTWNKRKEGDRRVVEFAREAAQSAEDARSIALQRQSEAKAGAADTAVAAVQAKADAEIATAQAQKARAEAEAQQARYDAESARQKADAERQAREAVEKQAAEARPVDARPQPKAQSEARVNAPSGLEGTGSNVRERELRVKIFEELNVGLQVLDTPRGLVVIVPVSSFAGQRLNSVPQLARVAAVLSRYPNLRVACEGYMSEENSDPESLRRAEAVRTALIENGVVASSISTQGYGNSRPVGPNTTAEGRASNSRVEIVASGDSIGTVPVWDRTYSLGRRD
jgi:flagellar motor protein MotB